MQSDDYARAVIATGQRMGITPRGIVIALATVLVESGSPIRMWANQKIPESLTFPHDAVGNDGYSCGLFQQQLRQGSNGQWWWGPLDVIMSPERSARLFFQRLAKRDYTRGDPGAHAQAIQGSAFPDRYGQRMGEARGIYERLLHSGNDSDTQEVAPMAPKYTELDRMTGGGASPRSRPPVNFLLHTEEGDSSAESLAAYCSGANGVSYHYTLRAGILCDVVDTDYASWSVLDANAYTINLCFAGSRAASTRADWLRRGVDIEIAAWIAVQDCRKYRIPTTVIAPVRGQYRQASGISDHRYVTRALGIGNHLDVGDGFPWDVFAGHINRFTTTNGGFLMALTDAEQKELLVKTRAIHDQMGPNLWGPESSMGKTADGKERTLRDGLAQACRDVAAIAKQVVR